MTTEEVLEILEEFELSPASVFNEDYDDTPYNVIGEVNIVHSEGGGEGQGEHVEVVIHLTGVDLYFKATAWYASYHGVDGWGNWELVKPVQRMVTFYE